MYIMIYAYCAYTSNSLLTVKYRLYLHLIFKVVYVLSQAILYRVGVQMIYGGVSAEYKARTLINLIALRS